MYYKVGARYIHRCQLKLAGRLKPQLYKRNPPARVSKPQDLRKFPFELPSVGAYSYTPLPYVVSVRKS